MKSKQTKIYLLHGWSYKLEKWDPVLLLLTKSGLKVERLKIPGLTDGTDQTWTLADYLVWLQSHLADQDRVILIGHSNGGRLALAFAASFPDKVQKLILIDSAGIYPRGLGISVKRVFFGTIAKLGKRLTTSKTLRHLLYKAARESDYHQATPAMRQTMANLISVDLRPELRKIQTPTLLIWGERDQSTPLADAKIMAAEIPEARLVVIPGAGHSPHLTHTNELVDLLERELK